MKIFLSETFANLWEGKDPFAEAEKLQGDVYRNLDGRTTLRFTLNGKAYFAKIHRGVGIIEILKNLIYLRLPVVGAENEWLAISRLQELGVETMTAEAFGTRGANPARRFSFLVTRALEPTQPMDEYCTAEILQAMGTAERRRVIRRMAGISRTLHDNGVNHRDYYLCHFLVDTGARGVPLSRRPLYLIDLHRVQLRPRTPRRWRLKDIAALYYSSFPLGLSTRDCLCFMREYRRKPLREVLATEKAFWNAVVRKAKALHRKGVRKGYHD